MNVVVNLMSIKYWLKMKQRIEDIIRYLAPIKEELIVREDEFIELFIKDNFIDNKKFTEEKKNGFKEAKKEVIFEQNSINKNSIEKNQLKNNPIEKNNYQKKIINSVNYISFVKNYFEDILRSKQDFTNNIPNKKLIIEPKSILGGILGWTILGWDTMGKRSDMFYSHMNNYVEVHEGIHTDDEYETRVISDWMLGYDPNYGKY